MKLLLDTHIFLWLNQAPERLPEHLVAPAEHILRQRHRAQPTAVTRQLCRARWA